MPLSEPKAEEKPVNFINDKQIENLQSRIFRKLILHLHIHHVKNKLWNSVKYFFFQLRRSLTGLQRAIAYKNYVQTIMQYRVSIYQNTDKTKLLQMEMKTRRVFGRNFYKRRLDSIIEPKSTVTESFAHLVLSPFGPSPVRKPPIYYLYKITSRSKGNGGG